MIQLVVGWVRDCFNFSKVGELKPVETISPSQSGYHFEPVETISLSQSQSGYHFEHEEIKWLMGKLKNFESVEFTDVYGTPLTAEIIDERFGPDGGIDCVIHITTKTERGAKNVATRIRNIIVKGED